MCLAMLMTSTARRLALVFLLSAATCAGAAPPAQPDAKGGQDSPLIRRFEGSWLTGYKTSPWDQAAFPTRAEVKDGKWAAPLVVEGRLTRVFYVAPPGKTPLEVFRNYEQALTAAGFKRRFACESDCSDLYFAMHKTLDYAAGATWSTGSLVSVSGGRYSIDSGVLAPDQGRMLYGVLPRGGQDVHVLLYTSVAENTTTDAAATFIQVVEPKAMPTGQVVVDARALQQDLKAAGKVALYGLYFDTGRAEIKPESKPQLDEMAKLLQSQPALKAYVVGHTDNQGSLESNLQLSQQRAAAVVSALASSYKVDAKRLNARGVANLAPVASNEAEEGRSRNRRVELVLQ